MVPVAKNTLGESMPVLSPDTTKMFAVDGSIGQASTVPLEPGIYRIAVRESTGNLGVMIKITLDGDTATTTSGMWMGQGSVEYFVIESESIISVLDGKINVVPFR